MNITSVIQMAEGLAFQLLHMGLKQMSPECSATTFSCSLCPYESPFFFPRVLFCHDIAGVFIESRASIFSAASWHPVVCCSLTRANVHFISFKSVFESLSLSASPFLPSDVLFPFFSFISWLIEIQVSVCELGAWLQI